MAKAAIYVRVSTVEQAEKGYSLGTQLEACRRKAAELGFRSAEDFIDDGHSGEYLDRPALNQLRSRVGTFKAVIVYDPDRLARNLAHQLLITEELENAGAELVFVSVAFEHSPEGKLFYSIRGAISAYEKEKIKERSLRGKRGKASKGKIIADAKPFGYRYDKGISNYLVHEEEAAIIRQMYGWLTEDRIGSATICKRLNEQGVPSPRLKKPWIVSAVYRILTNPLYKGTHVAMRYHYQTVAPNKRVKVERPESEWIEVPVPAIVTPEVWEAGQSQLRSNRTQATRNLKHEQLLNGLVYCAKCGRKMTIAYAGKSSEPISYYVCVTQRSNTYIYSDQPRCEARRVPTQLLDEMVYDHLVKLCQNPKLIKQYLSSRPSAAAVGQNLQTAMDRLRDLESRLVKQRDNVLRWYRQQMIPDDEAERQLSEIRSRLAEIEQNKVKIRGEMAAVSPFLSPSELVAAVQDKFRFEDQPFEDRRQAVRAVLERVVVERQDSTRARGSRPVLDIDLKFL